MVSSELPNFPACQYAAISAKVDLPFGFKTRCASVARRDHSSWENEMADQPVTFVSRSHAELPPTLTGTMAVLATATVIAMLYFAREVFIPITLAVLLSFLLAPAVRLLRRLRLGRIPAIGVTVHSFYGHRRVRNPDREGSLLSSSAAPGASIQP
jgi:hypothetical protein